MIRPLSTAEEDRRLCLRWARQWRREVPSRFRSVHRNLTHRIAALRRAGKATP